MFPLNSNIMSQTQQLAYYVYCRLLFAWPLLSVDLDRTSLILLVAHSGFLLEPYCMQPRKNCRYHPHGRRTLRVRSESWCMSTLHCSAAIYCSRLVSIGVCHSVSTIPEAGLRFASKPIGISVSVGMPCRVQVGGQRNKTQRYEHLIGDCWRLYCLVEETVDGVVLVEISYSYSRIW